jgi:LmbE family N-acetylglucosaminyl deacetylase
MRQLPSGCIASLFLLICSVPPLMAVTPADDAAFAAFGPRDRLLVVSPHPDDESLCCAGVMQQAMRAGASVAVVWITSGDGFEVDAMVVEHALRTRGRGLESLAGMRMAEARKAMTILGVLPERQYFFGYPDRGVAHLLLQHESTPYRSRYTGASAVPYPDAFSPGAPYTGQALMKDFSAVLDRERPTLVLAASFQDTHPDHRSSGELVTRAMAARGQDDRVRYWIVHGGEHWPRPLGLQPALEQTTPPRGAQMPWIPVALSAGDVAVKESAIRQYRTQFEVMARKLQAYVRRTELFSAQPAVD